MKNWQYFLQTAVQRLPDLLDQLELSAQALPPCIMEPDFPLRVPQPFIDRMRHGDPHDPLLLQVLARRDELHTVSGFSEDPLAEQAHNPVPGLLHKYHGRVLITATGHCAIHCRYCFRRFFPYQENNPGQAGWKKMMAYVAARPDIHEIILSGGDPLSASDALLGQWVNYIENIAHVNTLRIHSRLPIVIPQRITEDLLTRLQESRLHIVMVVHCNHPQEIDAMVQEKLALLRSAGVTLLNQAVLLKGVNDEASTLIQLSHRLFECGVLPYYLHQLDPVQGTAHFAVDVPKIAILHARMMAQLPGYLVPKFVREEAFAGSKVPIPLAEG